MDKKITIMIVLASLALLSGFIFWASKPSSPQPQSGDVISTNGLHWHPHLTIIIKGEEQEIPKDIGIAAVHNPLHTHDDTGTIHLEFTGLVKKDGLKLGQFFKVWEKKFSSGCIFEFCNGEKGQVKMTVKGRENKDFENYVMRDKDKIVINYN